jgi:hypothetical protein
MKIIMNLDELLLIFAWHKEAYNDTGNVWVAVTELTPI